MIAAGSRKVATREPSSSAGRAPLPGWRPLKIQGRPPIGRRRSISQASSTRGRPNTVPFPFARSIPAITHVDGTGRLQTVFREQSPRYYRLIERFGQATGIPVVLNTSFNLKGEPIVNTPANAFQTFSKSEMDTLILENCVIEKPSSKLGWKQNNRCRESG